MRLSFPLYVSLSLSLSLSMSSNSHNSNSTLHFSLFLLMNPSMMPRSSEILHSLRGLFYFQPFLSFCLVTKKAKKKINSFNKIRSLLFFFFFFLSFFSFCILLGTVSMRAFGLGKKWLKVKLRFQVFFFFFLHVNSKITRFYCAEKKTLFTYCLYTIHAPFTGPTILFTHLKIILLQYF